MTRRFYPVLPAIQEDPRVSIKTPRKRNLSKVPKINYSDRNLLSILRNKNKNYKVAGNVPNLALARNRQVVQNIINSARANYRGTNEKPTPPANRVKVAAQFKKNFLPAMNNLMRKHLKGLEELNKMLAMFPNKKLTRSLQGAVNALKANLRAS
jgi:hypothetical protein